MTPRKSSKKEPQILEMPPQKMAVVYAKGTPDKVFPELMPALYGSVYTLKFDLKKKGLPTFKVSDSELAILMPTLSLWTNGHILSVCLFLKIPLPYPRR